MDAFLQLTVGKDNVWTTETAQLSVDTVAIFVANDIRGTTADNTVYPLSMQCTDNESTRTIFPFIYGHFYDVTER